jgi:hypothetical protein
MEGNRTASSRFSLLHLIRPQGGFLCSTEHGKLCFEHLGMISDAQNNLPFAGAENTPKSGFV